MSTEADSKREDGERSGLKRPAPLVEHAGLEGPQAEHENPVERLARGIGNRNFTQVVARMADGEGILQGGRVHPDVEAAIAASRGQGQSLDRNLRGALSRSYGDQLSDVQVHTGDHANQLARAVSARAFTVGSDIFFANNEYNPGSEGGNDLIAHEVAHVVQQRGAPAAGPLTVTTPGDHLERDAEAAARDALA